jgi:hypothetical protein
VTDKFICIFTVVLGGGENVNMRILIDIGVVKVILCCVLIGNAIAGSIISPSEVAAPDASMPGEVAMAVVAVVYSPAEAVRIIQAAVAKYPEQAAIITQAACKAAPSLTLLLTTAAVYTMPHRAAAISRAVIAVMPGQASQVRIAADVAGSLALYPAQSRAIIQSSLAAQPASVGTVVTASMTVCGMLAGGCDASLVQAIVRTAVIANPVSSETIVETAVGLAPTQAREIIAAAGDALRQSPSNALDLSVQPGSTDVSDPTIQQQPTSSSNPASPFQ